MRRSGKGRIPGGIMRERDMTAGSPARLILLFALPMMAGNICQQLYTIVDAAFVGRAAGFQALAAVGSADWLNWLVMGVIWGYTQGFSILISQRYGAGEGDGVRRAVGQAVMLTAVISVLLLVFSESLTVPVLRLLKTPEDILPMAILYLRILFAGLPIMGAYNVQAGILRAVGDAKTPLMAMAVASAVNIALDALFVAVFRWGVAGAAAATLIAQAVSSVYCFRVIRKMDTVRVARADLRPDRGTAGALIRLGTPTALQNVVIGAGGTAIQRVLNGYGSVFIAGFTATNKLYGIMEMAAVSYGGALSAYAGQNYGAKKYRRIRRGVRSGVIMAVVTAAVIAVILYFAGRPVLSLFVSREEAQVQEVLDVAKGYLDAMLVGLPILYLLYVYRSSLQGMGDTVTPMLSGFMELLMRISAVLILPVYFGRTGVYFAELAAWTGAEILLMFTYYHKIGRLCALPNQEETL